jgi:UDP-N-acetyl-D-galactosamine dehydrogenase
LNVDVYDPYADKHEVQEEYGIEIVDKLGTYDAIVLAVSHKEFLALDFKALKKGSHTIIYDIKSFLERDLVNARL